MKRTSYILQIQLGKFMYSCRALPLSGAAHARRPPFDLTAIFKRANPAPDPTSCDLRKLC